MRRTLFALVTLLAAVLLPVGVAAAHSQLLTVNPADNAVLTEAPAQVVLTFNEDVEANFSKVLVTDGKGINFTTGAATAKGPVVTQKLLDLPAGTYSIRYRVVSKDAHPISGVSVFTVSQGASAGPSVAATTAQPTTAPALATEERSSRGLIGGLIGLGVFALLGGAVALLRRRRSAN